MILLSMGSSSFAKRFVDRDGDRNTEGMWSKWGKGRGGVFRWWEVRY
jgi:hypothetical protein